MLLDNSYTIVPTIRFTLVYDNGIRKVITVKTRDTIDCSYKKNGEKFYITGVVTKIGCNFNSSLGAVGTTAYLQVDGSSEYSGQVEFIQPSQILDLTIISTTDITDNVVCSVDNDDQKITLIRENEVGVFQYSLDSVTWKFCTAGQGMSAYECAVKLGFVGTEEEWLKSLKGADGPQGESAPLEIYKVFACVEDAEAARTDIPKGKLIAIKLDPAVLLVRNGTTDAGVIGTSADPIEVKGYDYIGVLTVGPQGPKGETGAAGKDGKSAYQYAVEGGYSGTEDEFMQSLARTDVAVTNYYMGQSGCTLTNTVIGPVDLRIFGYTNETTFKSKSISKIDISCTTETEDQSLIFPSAVILRAVPTSKESAKPNVVINGQKYVADCIMRRDGQIGVYRRVAYIESYNGETILGDWISSTGQLDMGAKVQYTTYGTFEPFDDLVQSQYKKLHSYDGTTKIVVTEDTYISISYPINVTTYIDKYVAETVQEYLDEKAPEIITPIVEEIVDEKIGNKQDKLTAGDHIFIDSTSKISVTDIGTLPENKTVVQLITDKESDLNTKIGKKQDTLTAGENITITNNVISSNAKSAIETAITVTKQVGGYSVGDVIPAGTQVTDIITTMLSPYVPPEVNKVYFGVSADVPTSLEGLTSKEVEASALIANGISNRFTSDNQRFVYAYKKSIGELISIKDSSGFENIDGWSKTVYNDGTNDYYIYYTNEALTVTSYKLTFIYTED